MHTWFQMKINDHDINIEKRITKRNNSCYANKQMNYETKLWRNLENYKVLEKLTFSEV